MNVRVVRRLIAVTIVGASLMACGSSGDDGSSTETSTTESPATTGSPATTAAPAPATTAAPVPTTAAPVPITEVSDGGGTATCDEASVAAGIGGDVAEVFDLECVEGWAAAFWTDDAGVSRPTILKAEGQFWILQDWFAVCEGDPMVPGDIAVPEPLRVYCPGG